jgi:hypothetical protein
MKNGEGIYIVAFFYVQDVKLDSEFSFQRVLSLIGLL